MVAEAKKQLEEGKDPIDVTIPATIGVLRNQTVGWQQEAYDFFTKNPNIVCHSWERCVTEGWNLGYQCMTSEVARTAVSKRLEAADSSFKLSLGTEREEDEDTMDSHMEGQEHEDDANIPATLLAALHLGDGTAPKDIEIGKDGAAEFKKAKIEEEWTDQDTEDETDAEHQETGASDAMSEGLTDDGGNEAEAGVKDTFDPDAYRPSYRDPDTMSESELEAFGPEELQEMADDSMAGESESGLASGEESGDEIVEMGPGPQSRSTQREAWFRAPSEIRVPHSLQTGFIDLTREE